MIVKCKIQFIFLKIFFLKQFRRFRGTEQRKATFDHRLRARSGNRVASSRGRACADARGVQQTREGRQGSAGPDWGILSQLPKIPGPTGLFMNDGWI